jgi:hypothetical protein
VLGGVLGVAFAEVVAAEVATWRDDLAHLSESGDYFLSLNRYMFWAVKR